ncbi:MAG: hypothetical protein Q4D56_07085 [Bacteroides sp.]|nr:hypothetical protein [Bacteroides sp.]
MKNTLFFLVCLFLLGGLSACSRSIDASVMLRYEHSLASADSLARIGATDSAHMVGQLSDLHREYVQIKEKADGKNVRLTPIKRSERILWFSLFSLSILLLIALFIIDIKHRRDRKHRRYLVELSENEERLHNNESERAQLEECLNEMSLTDEEREEVHQSLTNLLEYGKRLNEENASLHTRLKEYEQHPLPSDLELMQEQKKRLSRQDGQIAVLTSILTDRDDTMRSLHSQPKFLTPAQWQYLTTFADRVYDCFSLRLPARFPRLTAADQQLCLLMRLGFANAEIAIMMAVSPTSVSQQKFRLKKKLMQTEESLFANGETVDDVIKSF